MAQVTYLEGDALDTFLQLESWKDEPDQAADSVPATNKRDQIDAERNAIHDALARENDGLLADAVFSLRKPVEIAALLNRATLEQFAVLSTICNALRGDGAPRIVAPLSDSVAWNNAIRAAQRKRQASEHDPYMESAFSRQHGVAGAALRLEALGYKVGISALGTYFDDDTFKSICRRIDSEVKALGGRAVVEAVLRTFERTGSIYHGSLLHGRQSDQLPRLREPKVPLHYIYNLGLKHFTARPRVGVTLSRFVQLMELARDMAAVLDVETYTIYEQMRISLAKFHSTILDKVIYDELFGFRQWQPTIAPKLLSQWLYHLSEEGCELPLATVNEWTAFGCSLIAKAQVSSLFVTHPSDHASSVVSLKTAEALCEAISIPTDSLNVGYVSPLDTAKRNSPESPLYKLPGDLYVMPPRSMVARSLYEAIYKLLRNRKPAKLELIMGRSLEQLTADALETMGHRPPFVAAEYRLPGQSKKLAPYEVDVADEAQNHVYIFECKKKPLTNAARGGNSLSAVVDFAHAFLHPLVQLNRHEEQLRRPEGITFLDGRSLKLGNRSVQRIAVSMTDHGSMQDRVFIGAMIEGLWSVKLASGTPALQSEAEKVNAEMADLVSGITSLAALSGEELGQFLRYYTHTIWWFGIDQLFFLCSRADDLWTALSALRAVVFGSGDIMTEIAHYDRLGLLKRPTGRPTSS